MSTIPTSSSAIPVIPVTATSDLKTVTDAELALLVDGSGRVAKKTIVAAQEEIAARAAARLSQPDSAQAGATTGFQSYAMRSIRWLRDTERTHHDNIVDSKVWAVARRVMAVVPALIGVVFGGLADIVRGAAYNLSRGWKLHNSGTLNPTIVKVVSKIVSVLEPTKKFFQAIARRIDAVYEKHNYGRFFASNPYRDLDNVSIDEAHELARHFEGLSLGERVDGIAQLRRELESQTKSTDPDFFPDLGVRSNPICKVNDAVDRIQIALLELAIITSTRDDGTVDQAALADAFVLASIGDDGKVCHLTRDRRIKLFASELQKRGVILAAGRVTEGGSTPTSEAGIETPVAQVGLFGENIQAAELRLEAQENAKKAQLIAREAESKAAVAETSGVDSTIPGDQREVPVTAAPVVATIDPSYAKANTILEKIIRRFEERFAKIDEIEKYCNNRVQQANDSTLGKEQNLENLVKAAGEIQEQAMRKNPKGYTGIIESGIKPLIDLRVQLSDESGFQQLRAELTSNFVIIDSLTTQLKQINLPDLTSTDSPQRTKGLFDELNKKRLAYIVSDENNFELVQDLQASLTSSIKAVLGTKSESSPVIARFRPVENQRSVLDQFRGFLKRKESKKDSSVEDSIVEQEFVLMTTHPTVPATEASNVTGEPVSQTKGPSLADVLDEVERNQEEDRQNGRYFGGVAPTQSDSSASK